ncbi:MAG: DNA double-strand break repair nuclease NurA [Candidatus Nezhaarchaeales archaeon]
MKIRSLEDLMKLIRKMEFEKTEPELLYDLVRKSMELGAGERERLRRISKKSYDLFKLLKDKGFLCTLEASEEEISKIKKSPIGAVDGSFQVVGGRGGRWYVVLGIAQVIAKNGFTLQPTIKVDGDIVPLEGDDEGDVRRRAEITMMLGEVKALRKVCRTLSELGSESYILIDGPIMDPPLYAEKNYVSNRVNALRDCHERGVNVIGFVKRIMGNNYINYLSKEIDEDFSFFSNDLDLLSTVMFNAVIEGANPVYTSPIDYGEGIKEYERTPYAAYVKEGLRIYYSYYKPFSRGKIFRIEYASFEDLSEQELFEKFKKILSLINRVWTISGIDEPLLILIAHHKCNVRHGAAEKIYYEIMTRALSEGNIHLWLESLS